MQHSAGMSATKCCEETSLVLLRRSLGCLVSAAQRQEALLPGAFLAQPWPLLHLPLASCPLQAQLLKKGLFRILHGLHHAGKASMHSVCCTCRHSRLSIAYHTQVDCHMRSMCMAYMPVWTAVTQYLGFMQCVGVTQCLGKLKTLTCRLVQW